MKTLDNIRAITNAFNYIAKKEPTLKCFQYDLDKQKPIDVVSSALELDIPLILSPDEGDDFYQFDVVLPNGVITVSSWETKEKISTLMKNEANI